MGHLSIPESVPMLGLTYIVDCFYIYADVNLQITVLYYFIHQDQNYIVPHHDCTPRYDPP